MAWKVNELFNIYEGIPGFNYGRDIVDVEQVATKTAGKIQLIVRRHGFVQHYDFPSRRLKVTYSGTSVFSDAINGAYNEEDLEEQFSSTGYIELPSEWVGKSVTVTWDTEKDITLGAVAPRTVSIAKDDTIATLSVSRTASASGLGTVGTLKAGSIAYDTDKVKVDYSAKLGYEAEVSFGGKSVNSGEVVTVNGSAAVKAAAMPKATLNIYLNGKWNKYLIYVWRGAAWKLHQAHIYKDSKWDKYY